jgi:hypothetical protein
VKAVTEKAIHEFSHALPVEVSADYARLLRSFEQLLARHGIQKKAFSDQGLARFQSLPADQQRHFSEQLSKYLQVCLEAEASGIDIRYDSLGMLKYLCFRLRIRIPEEFLTTLTADDIIEIFDYHGNQLYRNLHFFEVSDYTIDDFFGNTWDYLYERSTAITKKIFAQIARTEQELECVPFSVPVHYMRERATENRKIVQVNLKYLAPLLKDGKAYAWIASSRATPVVDRSTIESESLSFI